MNSCVHIYTGDGKGKSTAALGLTVRCAGSGDAVVYTQFLKDGTSSELCVLKELSNIHIVFAKKSFGFFFHATEEKKAEAKIVYTDLFQEATALAVQKKVRLLVLDEIIAATNHGFVEMDRLIHFLKNRPDHLEVVLTGRNPHPDLIALADYVSEIKKIKHPFDKGTPARVGIEK